MGESVSVNWFIGIALFAALAWTIGVRLGQGPAWVARCSYVVSVGLMLGWGWLIRHPSVAVNMIPVHFLSRIEGVGGVPLFMLVLGVAWARSKVPRQRHVISWAMMLGAIYFVNGGMWLLQETPSSVMGQTVSPSGTRQSQDYSCVPAACATALNLLNIPTTEAQMAELTQVRPGTGATLIRAFDGLSQRLADRAIQPVLLEPTWDQLKRMPMPALTPVQYEPGRRHMVVISRILPDGVWIMDPVEGYMYLTTSAFVEVYRDQVIVFRRLAAPR